MASVRPAYDAVRAKAFSSNSGHMQAHCGMNAQHNAGTVGTIYDLNKKSATLKTKRFRAKFGAL